MQNAPVTTNGFASSKNIILQQNRSKYLGHTVSDRHIAIDPDKMKAVTDWPVLFKNFHKVQSFLGLISYLSQAHTTFQSHSMILV